jgi:UDPglucose 6-dehydrogenase
MGRCCGKTLIVKIGVIGYGYVGSAVAASYQSEVIIHDPEYPLMSLPIAALKYSCDAIFVCVPTPSSSAGCNTDILDQVLNDLIGYEGIVIVKSTAPPAWYAIAELTYPYNLAHVPEFLTQARAKFDYVNPSKVVVGCREEIRDQVFDVLFASAINFDRVDIEYCSIAEASFFKYMANSFLAMKVIMNNEFAQLAASLKLDWNKVSTIAKTDSRLGNTHWAVPGPDGAGFAGACFPKDTEALLSIARTQQINMSVLETAVTTNIALRS